MKRSSLFFGEGLFYFFVSLVPNQFLWIVEAIGFKSNRELGIEKLKKCWEEEKGYMRSASGILLFWINRFFFKDLKTSWEFFEKGTKEYAGGAMYWYPSFFFYLI